MRWVVLILGVIAVLLGGLWLLQGLGILYQKGALWSSMTLAENIAMPLEAYTDLTAAEVRELCSPCRHTPSCTCQSSPA